MKKIFQNMKKKQISEALVIVESELNERLGVFSSCDAQTRKMWLERDEVFVQAKRISELYAEFSQ